MDFQHNEEVQHCRNCDRLFKGKFCSYCGQKKFSDHDQSLFHFYEDAFHFITHFDSTLLTTLRTVFLKPGKWALDYTGGKRKSYFKPLSFFLMMVILYLLFPFFEGLNMRFANFQQFGMFKQHIQAYTEAKMTATGLSLEQLADTYDHQSEKFSKVLLLLIIPLTAVSLWLLHPTKKKWFSEHLVLSTEINSVFILIEFLIYPLIILLINKLGGEYLIDEDLTMMTSVLWFGSYSAVAIKRFYKESWLIALVKVIPFVLLHIFIVFILYKLLLFYTVMWFIG